MKKRQVQNMNKLLTFLFVSLFMVSANAVELNRYLNYEKAIKIAKKENKKVLMFVYSTHCPWCLKMKKNTLHNDKITKYINKNFILLMSNQDDDSFPEEFRAQMVPTTYFINAQTEESLYSTVGYLKPDMYYEELTFIQDE